MFEGIDSIKLRVLMLTLIIYLYRYTSLHGTLRPLVIIYQVNLLM